MYRNRDLAFADFAAYVEDFYNCTRRHSHLGGLNLEQVEDAQVLARRGVH